MYVCVSVCSEFISEHRAIEKDYCFVGHECSVSRTLDEVEKSKGEWKWTFYGIRVFEKRMYSIAGLDLYGEVRGSSLPAFFLAWDLGWVYGSQGSAFCYFWGREGEKRGSRFRVGN